MMLKVAGVVERCAKDVGLVQCIAAANSVSVCCLCS